MKEQTDFCIGIVGGRGQMGGWYARQLRRFGLKTAIVDRDTDLQPEDLPARCDVVLLSVPLAAAVEIAGRIGPLMRTDQLLMDICSQKQAIVEAMVQSTEAEVVGSHPLFGPFPESFREQNVILCPGRGIRWQQWLHRLLTEAGAHVSVVDAADHDRYMGLAQGFLHLVSICMGKTMQRIGIHPRDILPFSTPTFRIKLDLIGRLLAQDLNLYESLIRDNAAVPDLLTVFQEVLEDSRAELFTGERGRGAAYMKGIREYFGDFCSEALDESNAMIDAVYSKT